MAVTIEIKLDGSQVQQASAQVSAAVSSALGGVQDKLKAVESASTQATTKMVTGLQGLSASFRDSVASIHQAIQAHSSYAQSLKSIEQAAQQAARVTSSSVIGGRPLGGAGAESVASIQAAIQGGTALAQSLSSLAEGERAFGAAAKAATQQAKVGFEQLTGAVVALFAAFRAASGLTDFLRDTAMTAARTEVLGTVLTRVALTAGISSQKASEYAAQVKALGITTQESNTIITRFIQNNLDLSKATDLARVAQNAAAIAGTNSSEALSGLLHAILTLQPEIFRTYGLTVNLEQAYKTFAAQTGRTVESLSGQEKQTIALNATLTQAASIAGVYQAAMGDVGKQITSLPRLFEEASNAMGKAFLPSLRTGVSALGSLLTAFTNLPPGVQAAVSALAVMGAAFVTLTALATAAAASAAVAGAAFTAFWGIVTGPVGAVIATVTLLSGVYVALTAQIDRASEATRQQAKELPELQRLISLTTAATEPLMTAFTELASRKNRDADATTALSVFIQELANRFPELKAQLENTATTFEARLETVKRFTGAVVEQEAKVGFLTKAWRTAQSALETIGRQQAQVADPFANIAVPGAELTEKLKGWDARIAELKAKGIGDEKMAITASFDAYLDEIKKRAEAFNQLGGQFDVKKITGRLQQLNTDLKLLTSAEQLPGAKVDVLKAYGYDEKSITTGTRAIREEIAKLNNELVGRTSQRIENQTSAEITGATTQVAIIQSRFQTEAALLSTAQQQKEVALQEETQAALSAENLTQQGREEILRAANLKQLELTRDNTFERIELEKTRVTETLKASDAVIAAEIARQNAMKSLGPQATDDANAAIRGLLGKRTADHAKASADMTKLDADAAKAAADFEMGLTKVKADEGTKQLQRKKQQLEAEAALRLTTLQGEAAILDAQLALNQANVQSQLGLVQNSMLAQIDIKQQGFQEEARLRDQLFQNEAKRIQERADLEIQRAKDQSRDTVGIQEKADDELEALGIRRQAVMRGLRNQEEQEWRRFVERVQDVLGNFLYDIFSGQIRSIQDVLTRLKNFFLRTLADMIAAAIANPVSIIIRQVVGSIAGAATQAAIGLAGAAVGGSGGSGGTGGSGLGTGAILPTVGLANQFGLLGGVVTQLSNGVTFAAQSVADFVNAMRFGTSVTTEAAINASAAMDAAIPGVPAAQAGTGAGAATAGQVLGIAGGLAALGGGIYAALNASNNAARAAYAASAAAGAFAAGAAAYGAVTGGALVIAGTTGWTGIGLIVAAVMAVIGVVLDRVIKPAGPSLSVGRPRGLNIVAEESGQLGVQGDLGTRVTRRIGVTKEFANSVQAQMEEGVTNAVLGMIQAINAVALDPAALLGPTNEALQAALEAIQPLNTANAKKMSQDITEQLRFINVQVVSGLLGPLNLAFDQLIDAKLEDQLQRLPGTTAGMLEIFKNLNTQLDEIGKSENTDVLRQLSSVRNKVEDFGAKIANTAGATAERIVDAMLVKLGQVEGGPTAQLDGADAAVQKLDRSLAEQITDLNVLMTTSLQALGTLRGTAQLIDEAGLSSTRIMAQIERLVIAIGEGAARISTEIVTTALGDLTVETQQVTAQPMGVQPTTVASLYTDSLAALQALWGEWHRLEQMGIDATGIHAQWDRLLAGLFESAGQIIDNAFRQGSFSEFLTVLASIPKALTDLNPTWAKLAQVGQVFAQVVGPIAQVIATLEDELRSAGDRIALTAQRMTDLRGAIAQAGDSAEQALPLYAQLAQAIQANGAAQIEYVNEQAEEWNTVARERADAELKIAQEAADAQLKVAQEAADAQMEALNALIERETKAINDWAEAANTTASQLSSVNASILGEQSPTVQRQTLEGQKAALEAVVNATGSPEALTELIRVNQQLLALAKESDDLALLQRSLDELAAIQQNLTNQLFEMTGESDPILAQITVAQAQEARLQEISDYQETQTKAIQETLENDTTRIQATLDAQTQAIQATLEARLAEVAEWQKNTIAAIKEDMVLQLKLVQYELQKLFIIQYKAFTGVDLPPPTALGQQGGRVPAVASLNRAMTGPLEVHHYAAGGAVQEMPREVAHLMRGVDRRYASLGVPRFAEGGQVSVKLEPGEGVFVPPFAPKELQALQQLNDQIPRFAMAASGTAEPTAHRFGGVVPGTGTGDIVSATVPLDSFVLNREAMRALAHPMTAQIPENIVRLVQPLVSGHQPSRDDRWSGPIEFPMERSRGSGGTPGYQGGGSVPGNGGKPEVHHHDNRVIFHLPNLTIRSHQDLEELKRALAELARRGLKR